MDTSNGRWQWSSHKEGLLKSSVRNINAEYLAKLSSLERIAIFMSDRVGTPGFFLLVALWTVGWVLWNSYGPPAQRFDNGMEFAVWIFVANVMQLLLMPLLLIAQNLQTRHDGLRAENDYQVTVESKKEIEVMLAHLYQLTENVKAVMDHLEISQEAVRKKDRIPDVVEEQFAARQQQLLDEMSLKLALTHGEALDRANQFTAQVTTEPRPGNGGTPG